MHILIVAGSVMLLLSLLIAWILVAVRYLHVPGLTSLITNGEHLLKAHIDYLFMALLLYAFSLLGTTLPIQLQAVMVIGAFTNPLLFIVIAIKPTVSRAPFAPIGIFATLSFLTTTIGFGGAAILVASTALGQ